jgi:hypothetical protein
MDHEEASKWPPMRRKPPNSTEGAPNGLSGLTVLEARRLRVEIALHQVEPL